VHRKTVAEVMHTQRRGAGPRRDADAVAKQTKRVLDDVAVQPSSPGSDQQRRGLRLGLERVPSIEVFAKRGDRGRVQRKLAGLSEPRCASTYVAISGRVARIGGGRASGVGIFRRSEALEERE